MEPTPARTRCRLLPMISIVALPCVSPPSVSFPSGYAGTLLQLYGNAARPGDRINKTGAAFRCLKLRSACLLEQLAKDLPGEDHPSRSVQVTLVWRHALPLVDVTDQAWPGSLCRPAHRVCVAMSAHHHRRLRRRNMRRLVLSQLRVCGRSGHRSRRRASACVAVEHGHIGALALTR